MAIGAYAILVGPGASIWRAAIMGWFGLFGRQLGRRQDGLNSLAVAAALMGLQNPDCLWDVGFQLSFGATLGLILYAQPFQDAFQRLISRWLRPSLAERLARSVGQYVLFTLAAQIVTLPLMMYHFRQVSFLALLANPIILPPQEILMVLGLATLVGGLIHPILGQGLAYLAWPFAAFTVRAVEWLATIPPGVIELGPTSVPVVILLYAALFGLTYGWPRFIRAPAAFLRSLVTPPVMIAGLAIAAALVWNTVLSGPDGNLHLTLIEAGPDPVLLVQTPGGRSLLVNGGDPAGLVNQALGERLPVLERRLDGILVASAADRSLQALPEILASIPAGRLWWAASDGAGDADPALAEYLVSSRLPVQPCQPGQRLNLGDGASLEVTAAGKTQASLLLQYGSFRALVWSPPDHDLPSTWKEPVTVLVIAESSLDARSFPAVLAASRPRLVLVAHDPGDQDPSPDLYQALKGYSYLRTGQNGWAHLATDGKQLWTEARRKSAVKADSSITN